MSKITTDDCKAFLKSHAETMGWSKDDSWKRTSKTKSDQGAFRVFKSSSGFEVSLLEAADGSGLKIISLIPASLPISKVDASVSASVALVDLVGSTPITPLKSVKKQLKEMFTPSKKIEDPMVIDFDSESKAMQAAILWTDAMRVLGGKAPLYVEDPSGVTGGLRWIDLKTEIRSYGDPSNFIKQWAEESMKEVDSCAFVLSRSGWYYLSDAMYLEGLGLYDASEGSHVAFFALDVPHEEPGRLGHPFNYIYDDEVEPGLEGVVSMGKDSLTGQASMIKVWDQMQALGLQYDITLQKKYTSGEEQGGDTDEEHPLHRKVFEVIPALKAQKEALELARVSGAATSKPSKTKKKMSI